MAVHLTNHRGIRQGRDYPGRGGRNNPNKVSESPSFVYLDEYGEQNPRKKPDTQRSLVRATRRASDNRGRSHRASFEKFQDASERDGLLLDPEAFGAWLKSRKEIDHGGEHTVYLDSKSQRAVKITHPDMTGDGVVGHPASLLVPYRDARAPGQRV